MVARLHFESVVRGEGWVVMDTESFSYWFWLRSLII